MSGAATNNFYSNVLHPRILIHWIFAVGKSSFSIRFASKTFPSPEEHLPVAMEPIEGSTCVVKLTTKLGNDSCFNSYFSQRVCTVVTILPTACGTFAPLTNTKHCVRYKFTLYGKQAIKCCFQNRSEELFWYRRFFDDVSTSIQNLIWAPRCLYQSKI